MVPGIEKRKQRKRAHSGMKFVFTDEYPDTTRSQKADRALAEAALVRAQEAEFLERQRFDARRREPLAEQLRAARHRHWHDPNSPHYREVEDVRAAEMEQGWYAGAAWLGASASAYVRGVRGVKR